MVIGLFNLGDFILITHPVKRKSTIIQYEERITMLKTRKCVLPKHETLAGSHTLDKNKSFVVCIYLFLQLFVMTGLTSF